MKICIHFKGGCTCARGLFNAERFDLSGDGFILHMPCIQTHSFFMARNRGFELATCEGQDMMDTEEPRQAHNRAEDL